MRTLCIRLDRDLSIGEIKEIFINNPIELGRYIYIIAEANGTGEKLLLHPKKRFHIGYSAVLPEIEIKIKKINNINNLNVKYQLSKLEKLKILFLLISIEIFQIALLVLNIQHWDVLLIVSIAIIVFLCLFLYWIYIFL